jgi:hypothetical protein
MNEEEIIAAGFLAVRTGILTGNWERVCEGYNLVSGESLEPPSLEPPKTKLQKIREAIEAAKDNSDDGEEDKKPAKRTKKTTKTPRPAKATKSTKAKKPIVEKVDLGDDFGESEVATGEIEFRGNSAIGHGRKVQLISSLAGEEEVKKNVAKAKVAKSLKDQVSRKSFSTQVNIEGCQVRDLNSPPDYVSRKK